MKLALILAALLLLVAAGTTTAEIVIGSFNIEWFGHGNNPRTDYQIAVLANYIRALEVDILACQEIHPTGDKSGNGIADWEDLMNELGDGFAGWVGKTGGSQRLAFIWRTNRIGLSDLGELSGVAREDVAGTDKQTFPRIPITAYVKSLDGGIDFRIITVHLYYSDDEARYAEATQLNEWVSSYLGSGYDSDLAIIGDCNTKSMGSGETASSTTIANFETSGMLTCISSDHDEYTTPTSMERYDHAFLTSDFLAEFVEDSWDVRREVVDTYPEFYRFEISNHVPVVLRVLDEDNDTAPMGDWGNWL